jgi:hypothetical protein
MAIELQAGSSATKPSVRATRLAEYLEEQRLLRTLQVPREVDGKLLKEVRTLGLKTRQEHFARLVGIDITVLRRLENSGEPLFKKTRRKTLLTLALMLELIGVRFTLDGWELKEGSVAMATAEGNKPGCRYAGENW